MSQYESILKLYESRIIKEENKDPKYQAYFKKMLKKFGVSEPDQLEGVKKKEFYNAVDKGWKADKETDIDEAAESKLVGWIAIYNSKKFEIKKSEANGIYGAKQLAIKHFKVPKSKEGLLAIEPGYED